MSVTCNISKKYTVNYLTTHSHSSRILMLEFPFASIIMKVVALEIEDYECMFHLRLINLSRNNR